MSCMVLAIWVLSLVEMALASVPTAVHVQCPAPRTTAMKFSILSSRNQTGHWNCEVVLGHSAMQPDTSSGPWEIDVEQSTQHCAQGGETVLITAVLTVPAQVGLPGYTLLPGHGYYRVHRIPATWDEARRTCLEEGAQLLVINGQAEAAAVRDSLLSNLVIEGTSDNSYLHVGFHDLFAEGQFVTVTGEPLSSSGYLTWSWNEPNNDGNEDCGSIHRNMALNDVLCSKRLYFICEQGL